MQQTAREANTKFWGIGLSFVTLTLRFDMHDIHAFGRENWPFVRLYGTKKNTLLDGKRRRGKEKQRDYIIQKAHILSFSRSHCVDAIQQGVFLYHVTLFCKRPIPGSE